MTIIKRETEAMGRIHVYDAYAAPCDDPESQLEPFQMVAKDRENFQRGKFSQGSPSEGLPGQATFGHSSVERSPRCVRPDQLVVVFRLQLPQAEGISGNLRLPRLS
jgi:hypothetical protein